MIDWNRLRDPNFRDVPPKLGTMGLALAAVAFLLALATASDYGIASDVANYFASSRRLVDWAADFLAGVGTGRPTRALESERVFEAWRWYLPRLPHPPLARELSGLTWLLGHRWMDSLTAYRLAVMLSYGALTGWVTVFTFWATRSRIAGLAAGLAVLAYPTLFAHAHLAHTDLLLATFWFSSAAALAVFERTRSIGWLFACGLLLGAAAATKFSGLLLVPVVIGWLIVRRPREALPAVFLVSLSAAILFYLVNPVLWVEPAVGVIDYWRAGAARLTEPLARLRTEYFGVIHDFRPPVHYPWVWTLIVLPPTFIAAAGVAISAIRRGWLVPFCLVNMAALYGALLLPQAPMHDGVRLLLPALPFQCVLVGVGVDRAVEWLGDRLPGVGSSLLPALVLVAVIGPAAASTVRAHPYQLSWANFLVGGTRGAAERGLEVTNLKEVLSRDVLGQLDTFIPDGAIVDPGFMTEELCFYQAQGYVTGWTVETSVERPGETGSETLHCPPGIGLPAALPRAAREPDFVLVLNRRAVWRPMDRALFEHGGPPAYELSLDGVPLLRAYRTN